LQDVGFVPVVEGAVLEDVVDDGAAGDVEEAAVGWGVPVDDELQPATSAAADAPSTPTTIVKFLIRIDRISASSDRRVR
jgi:hypothetical protein